jgi:hypothetical protein
LHEDLYGRLYNKVLSRGRTISERPAGRPKRRLGAARATLVVDFGSCSLKAGWAADGFPAVVTPSADGRRRLVLGDARRTTDWDGVCALWERTFAGDLQVVALTLALPTLKRASCHTRTK